MPSKNLCSTWLNGLDSGNLEQMVERIDSDVVICNEYNPTTIGIQALKDKYGPMIETANFKSSADAQEVQVYDGSFAVWIGRFNAQVTSKASGDIIKNATGRLIMTLRKDKQDGLWKVLLDVDNNVETDERKE